LRTARQRAPFANKDRAEHRRQNNQERSLPAAAATGPLFVRFPRAFGSSRWRKITGKLGKKPELSGRATPMPKGLLGNPLEHAAAEGGIQPQIIEVDVA